MFCSRCGTWAPDDTATCTLCGLALQVDNWPAASRPGAPASASAAAAVLYAGFWRRAAAVLLDTLVMFFPEAIVRVLMGLPAMPSLLDREAMPMPLFGTILAMEWIYSAAFIASRAAGTLGMQVMGIRVTRVDGGRVTFLRATFRWLALSLDLITLGLGYLLMLITPRRQTLHDLAAGTVVTRVPGAGVPHGAPPVLRVVPR